MKINPTACNIKDIKICKDLQVRELSEDHILNLMDAIKMAPTDDELKQPPPIIVYKITDRPWEHYVLIDGWHRLQARLRLHQDIVYVYAHKGTFQEALDHAIRANTTHALSLSRADRRRAVYKLLKVTPQRSNKWISTLAGISDQVVKDIRVEMEQKGDIPIIEKCIGKDGKEYDSQVEREKKSATMKTIIYWHNQDAQANFMRAIDDISKKCGSEKINHCAEMLAVDYLAGEGIKVKKKERMKELF